MVARKVLVCAVTALGALLVGITPAGALPALDPDGDPGGGGGGGGGTPVELDWHPAIEQLGGIDITVLPTVTPLLPELQDRAPWGRWSASCANDFCMPDLPITSPFCMDPVNLPGDNMVRDGRNYGNIARSCYQLILALAFQPATGVDPNPIEFTLQQFQRNIHQQCNEQFPAYSLNKYRCYGASGVAKEMARPLVNDLYGRIEVFGFNAPPTTFDIPPFPHPFPIAYSPAGQYSHAFIATCRPGGASPCGAVAAGQAFGPGSRLFLTGVVRPRSKILYTFVDPTVPASDGNVLGYWITAEARENGVVHHEREEYFLDRIRRGPVRVVATYLRWEDNRTVTTPIADINLTAGSTGGGGGGGNPCDLPTAREAVARAALPSDCDVLE